MNAPDRSMHLARPAQADFAAALLDPARACPQGLVAWNGSDPAARFAVYRNNVIVSLVDALADTFDVVRQLVGDDFFRAMATAFVRTEPPRSPVLAMYGERFAGFIAGFAPARSVPYLADVAALEHARVQAFHAADVAPVGAEAVAAATACGERIGALRIGLHPSVRLLQSSHPMVSVWGAHQGEGELAAVDLDTAERALVLRDGDDVLVLRLRPGEFAFVQALQCGAALGEAVALAMPGFDLTTTLAMLHRHGAIVALDLPRKDTP